MSKSPSNGDSSLIKTGIPELDNILGGGLTRDRVYLVEGTPGSGKTTLAMQFLLEGRAQGERGLCDLVRNCSRIDRDVQISRLVA